MTVQGAMASNSMGADPLIGERVRVRTPGKHIVLFITAALVIVLGALSVLRTNSASVHQPPSIETYRIGQTHFVPLQEFLVDLSPDKIGRVTYMRLSASVTVDAAKSSGAVKAIESKMPEIRERTVFLLRALSPEDFEGAEDMARVKKELLRRVNLVIAPEIASDVVINELTIQ